MARRRQCGTLRFWLGGVLLLAAGCSGGPGGSVSPRAAADQAMADFDTNKDGALDAKELEACPGLKSAMKRVDKDNDGRLTADEIADRLTFLQQAGPQFGVVVEVTFDGRSLSGAIVTLVPEKFLGPSFKPASATTDAAGIGTLQVEGSDQGIAAGFYRVEVSKKGPNGQEQIPARYNAKTVLGQEIAPDAAGGRGAALTVRLQLTSK